MEFQRDLAPGFERPKIESRFGATRLLGVMQLSDAVSGQETSVHSARQNA